MTSVAVIIDVGAILALGGLGVLCAWLMRRYSTLSARNLYPPGRVRPGGAGAGVAVHAWSVVLVIAPVVRADRLGRRSTRVGCDWRIWAPARSCGPMSWRAAGSGSPHRRRLPGERVYLRSQGELVHRRPGRRACPYVSMSERRARGLRLPLGDGQHIFACGATGSGKTTTMRRVLAARTLMQRAALLILDQKGDQEDVEQMSRLAAAAGVPFVLFDPQDPGSDRYQPLWGTPAQVAARAVEPIKQSEPYYYDVLRLHLDMVCRVLHAADRWPPSIPFLIDACHPRTIPALQAIASGSARHTASSLAASSSTPTTCPRARAPRISPAAPRGCRSRWRSPAARS